MYPEGKPYGMLLGNNGLTIIFVDVLDTTKTRNIVASEVPTHPDGVFSVQRGKGPIEVLSTGGLICIYKGAHRDVARHLRANRQSLERQLLDHRREASNCSD